MTDTLVIGEQAAWSRIARTRLLVLAWAIGLGAYVAMLSQEVGLSAFSAGNLSFAVVGTVLVLRRPGNVIGPIMIVLGVGFTAVIALDVAAGPLADGGQQATASWMALVASVASVPLLWAQNVALWLLFPDGRLRSRGERRFMVASAIWCAVAVAVSVLAIPQPRGPGIPSQPHPFLDGVTVDSLPSAVLGVLIVPLFLCGLVLALRLIVRARRNDGVERRQVVVVATAVVAVAFEPIRRRLQRVADRIVYGQRSTPHEVLTDLTARLEDSGAGRSLDELARLVAQGTAADQAVIVRGSGPTYEVEGRWSRDESTDVDLEMGSVAVDDALTVVESIRHGDVLLGRVIIRKPPSDPVAPPDRELLTDVAAGAGLVLRNIALNRELEQRAVEVRESRRRLIAAQDAERHRLERDLHDGAQQQIVALKVKLGLAQTIARREGADDIPVVVEGLAVTTQEAVDAMRVIAHGIYSPLLEAEGLGAALASVARTSPTTIHLDAAAVARCPRPVEETVYFCVQETVQRGRDAGIDDLYVTLTEDGGDHLTLTLVYRGPTLDLGLVTDRIDAFGGTVEDHTSADTQGLTCRIPVAALVREPA